LFLIALSLTLFLVSCTPDMNKESYTVTFDKNGGYVEANPKSIKIEKGQPIINLPEPPKRGRLEFDHWDSNPDGKGYNIDALTIIDKDITAYAQWALYNFSFSTFKNTGIDNIGWYPIDNYEYILIHVTTLENYKIDKINIVMDGKKYETNQEWSKIEFDDSLDTLFTLKVTASATLISN
jgi:hypothetical protein